MGKSLSNDKTRLYQLTRTASQVLNKPPTKHAKPTSQSRRKVAEEVEPRKMEGSSEVDGGRSSENTRLPLSEVVADCVKRWFKDTLKEAKAGDINMQVLVGQMYYSGYGVARDPQKVNCYLMFLFFVGFLLF